MYDMHTCKRQRLFMRETHPIVRGLSASVQLQKNKAGREPQRAWRQDETASREVTPTLTDEESVSRDRCLLRRNPDLSRREQKSLSWISRRHKSGMTVLAKTSSNLTGRPKSQSWLEVGSQALSTRAIGGQTRLLGGRQWRGLRPWRSRGLARTLNTEAEESTALGAVTKERVMKT
jgi:hypothetical protein